MITRWRVSLAGSLLFTTMLASGASDIHWEYSGSKGPDYWGDLTPKFSVCSSGKNQSPIDVTDTMKAELPALDFLYNSNAAEILNNGHTVQINFRPGSMIEVGGRRFELQQFHVHAPSENRIGGQAFPLEGHLVHADRNGNLAVVAVMYEVQQVNKALNLLWDPLPEKAGDRRAITRPVTAADLLPVNWAYYRFNGSLTTPPCTEGVWWLVLKTPAKISREQAEMFSHVMRHP
ncbi:MAG TPA: carbonic anhydrase family protein, partial [Candidatus Competibacteraceae bacterium]|nr:carbonic anhydrase family protein [Candidatus Competibacteraceae bacterium]